MRFEARMEIRGINPFVFVDADRAESVLAGARGPVPVRVQVNDFPDPAWRINLIPAKGGGYYLYLHAQVRRASCTGVGDTVTVHIEHDSEYRGGPAHAVPVAFQDALAGDAVATQNWDRLSPSRRKEVLRYLDALRSGAAVERNIVRVMRVLGGEPGRFMARDWRHGR